MGKKKLSLKPVSRGFATTSVVSKEARPSEDRIEKPQSEVAPQAASSRGISDAEAQNEPPDKAHAQDSLAKDDWEDPEALERIRLQELVDRLNDKGEKEVARVLKAIDFDRRLAKTLPTLALPQNVRDRILQLALEENHSNKIDGTILNTSPSAVDKIYIRFYVAHQVLTHLGFRPERISQCLIEGIGEGDDWEVALEWMWLHLSEDECLNQGDFAPAPEPENLELGSLHMDAPSSSQEHKPLPQEQELSAIENTNTITDASATSDYTTSLFQPLASSSASSSSDSDSEVNLNLSNEVWAKLMLKLDALRAPSKGSKSKKGKNANHVGTLIDTSEASRLKEKISKLEKEYFYNRKEAEMTLKALRAQRDAAALEQRMQGRGEPPKTENKLGGPEKSVDVLDSNMDEDDENIFGALLAEGEDSFHASSENANTVIAVRSMPIAKQHLVTGNTPKNMLRLALSKSSKTAVTSYVCLSGASRAVRAGLEVRWSSLRRRIWRMEDIACDNTDEAENYVATWALNDLGEEFGGVNWRSMPPAFRQLWEELDAERTALENVKKRDLWAVVKGIIERKSKQTVLRPEASVSQPKKQEKELPEVHHQQAMHPQLQRDFERRMASPLYRKMKRFRDDLPIAAFREQIAETLATSQVMVLSGETGCGKSTQLPSFILEDQLSRGQSCKILVTEPRRISAISLASRVAQELGESNGPGSLVGYSIRLEAKMSTSTRLAFVTNGIALRMLEGSSSGKSAFDDITHIVVDEVHERSIESDFLLLILRTLLATRKDLKVILMSATIDAEKISTYFGGCPYLAVPGRTFPVDVNYLEDAVEITDWHIDEANPYAIRSRKGNKGAKQIEWSEEGARTDDAESEDDEEADPTKLSSTRYSVHTVNTVNLLDTRQIPYDLIVRLLEKICFESTELQSYSNATLIFLPGLAEIRRLNDFLSSHPSFGSSEFIVYPLHSSLSSEAQSSVFDIPPSGIRKIVISTNIAETGVTIPDITCVIDSGKHREMRFDEKRQISRLIETYIARSNAKQRRGRAGRVQKGIAFHLFTKARHDTQLSEHPTPEMLRLSLQDLAMRIKILKVQAGATIEEVLSHALDPPSTLNIQRAIAALVEVKALTSTQDITPMGRLLSKIPIDVHLGKFLLMATIFRCLDPALTIAATLSAKSPFVAPFGLEAAANAAKRAFATGHSDFVTIANVFDSWRRAADNPSFVRKFCHQNFLSYQNLQQIEDLRQQFLSCLIESSFVRDLRSSDQLRSSSKGHLRFSIVPEEVNNNGGDIHILNAALAAGLYPKLICLDQNGGLKTLNNQQPVAIHPSSVNFKLRKAEFETNYLTYFSIVHSKRLYAWETGPVDDQAVALLCGDQMESKLLASSVQIDRKIRYQMAPKSALAMRILRQRLTDAMSMRLRGRPLSDTQTSWLELGLQCLTEGPLPEKEIGLGIS